MNILAILTSAALVTDCCWSMECGDISYTKMAPQEIVQSSDMDFVFPWNALIKWKFSATAICLATIVQTDQWTTKSNHSSRVVTAAHCFRKNIGISMSRLDSFRVLVGFNYAAKPAEEGKAYQIKSKKLYGQLYGTEQIKRGIAVLELKEPIMFTETVRPICMPKRSEKIPDNPLCFMPVYQKDKKRIKEFLAPVAKGGQCALWQSALGAARGYCVYYTKKLGSPLICLVSGKLVQFGIYTTEFNANYKGTQTDGRIGYANDLTLLTSIIAGKLYETGSISMKYGE